MNLETKKVIMMIMTTYCHNNNHHHNGNEKNCMIKAIKNLLLPVPCIMTS